MKQHIPSSEVAFHPLSFQDEAGRLFTWRGELYRAISAQAAPYLAEFVQSELGRELVADGLLIETEVTPFALEGFALVLRHRRLPFVSYPFEWCPAMFKAATLTVLDLATRLSRHGMRLADGHPWNVLFDGPRPIWIDLTSVLPGTGDEGWVDEFRHSCLHRLIFMSQGREKLAKAIIAGGEVVREADLETLGASRSLMVDVATAVLCRIPTERRAMLRKTLRPVRSLLRRKDERAKTIPHLDRLQQLRVEVENVTVPFAEAHASSEAVAPPAEWNAKQRSLHEILARERPRTVLDIASGSGWSTELAAEVSENVVAFDAEPDAVSRLFASARARQLPILPLLMDFTRPTAAQGLANHSYLGAESRIQCEMVLMLGFLHELVFRYRRLGMNEICDGLAMFSQRWVVVEFIPGDDPEVGPLWSNWFAHYTLENFKLALRRHFPKIEVWPSYPDTRVLLLCERALNQHADANEEWRQTNAPVRGLAAFAAGPLVTVIAIFFTGGSLPNEVSEPEERRSVVSVCQSRSR